MIMKGLELAGWVCVGGFCSLERLNTSFTYGVVTPAPSPVCLTVFGRDLVERWGRGDCGIGHFLVHPVLVFAAALSHSPPPPPPTFFLLGLVERSVGGGCEA